ncbi:MAG: hypothetical protein ACJA1R_002760 [Flavobacteriales bacterium]|jgi:hypothetical protein
MRELAVSWGLFDLNNRARRASGNGSAGAVNAARRGPLNGGRNACVVSIAVDAEHNLERADEDGIGLCVERTSRARRRLFSSGLEPCDRE